MKTTGGKGLHVVLPIAPTPWDEAKDFCRKHGAEAMAADSRTATSRDAKKSARGNRIFLDYLRNSREATAIAPTRPARGRALGRDAVVMDELGSLKAANAFTVTNIGKRLAGLREDPWQEMGRLKQRLPRT